MLKPEELVTALHAGVKASGCCTRFCTYGAVVDDGRYTLHHNGVGTRDTDSQTVHTDPALGMPAEKFAERISLWIVGLHRGERVSLNAA